MFSKTLVKIGLICLEILLLDFCLAQIFDVVFHRDRRIPFLKIVWKNYQRFPFSFPLQVLAKIFQHFRFRTYLYIYIDYISLMRWYI
jgi:hypothetical protein